MTSIVKRVDLQRLLCGAQLPALPQSAITLLELSRDPNNGPPEFAVPIEADPGLTGQVLRFVNSSYFGFSHEISSVRLAVTLVGIRTIKNFALWSAVFSLMPNPKCGPLELKNLWSDSVRRGLLARSMAKLLGVKDAENAFAAALLQDMAIPLLAKQLPADYVEMLENSKSQKRRLSQLEQERIGWTHAQAGGLMARAWKLPLEFADLIEQHTQAISTAHAARNPVQTAVALSSLLPSATDETWLEAALFEQHFSALQPTDGPGLHEFLAQIDREFTEFAPVLKIGTAVRTLVEHCGEAATAV